MDRKKLFENAILDIHNFFSDNFNQESRIRAIDAVNSLRILFRDLRDENSYLTKLTNEMLKVPVSAILPQKADLTSSESKSSYQELDINVKVKFLLRKCKELYNLIQEYDLPTEDLVKSTKRMKAQLSVSARQHQECFQRMFNEGLIEDISSLLNRLTESANDLEIKDPRHALVHYVTKKNILRQKEKSNAYPKLLPEKENEKVMKRETMKKLSKTALNNTRECKKHSSADAVEERQNYYHDEIMDDENVPYKILADLYGRYPLRIADKVIRLTSSKKISKLQSSTTNILRELSMQDPDLDLDCCYSDWTDALSSQEDIYRQFCSDNLQEKKFRSQLRIYTTRLKGRHFPEMKHRERSIARFKSSRIISSPIIRKFKLTEKGSEFFNHPPSLFAKEKRQQNVKVDPSAKEHTRLAIQASKDEEKESEGGGDLEFKEQDEELRAYIGKLNKSRVETMERLEQRNLHEYSKGFYRGLESSAKIAIPYINSDIIKQRLIKYEEMKMALPQARPSRVSKTAKQVRI